MSAPSFLRPLLLAAFALSVSSVAFARRPPSLEQFQESSARALAGCAVVAAPGGSGYRDMLVRFDPLSTSRTEHPVTQRASLLIAHPVKAGHRVALCGGHRIHIPSGYRDMLDRIDPGNPSVQIARAHSSH
jgi:hypothetical protein